MLLLFLLRFPLPLSASAEYLSAIPFDSTSTSNSFGASSPFKSEGVNNSFSPYRSPFSNQSAMNPFATDALQRYARQGNYCGKLSVNPYDADSTSNPFGQYSSPFSQDSISKPYGLAIPTAQTAPPIRMAQAGASKGDSSPVLGLRSGGLSGHAQQPRVANPQPSEKVSAKNLPNLDASARR